MRLVNNLLILISIHFSKGNWKKFRVTTGQKLKLKSRIFLTTNENFRLRICMNIASTGSHSYALSFIKLIFFFEKITHHNFYSAFEIFEPHIILFILHFSHLHSIRCWVFFSLSYICTHKRKQREKRRFSLTHQIDVHMYQFQSQSNAINNNHILIYSLNFFFSRPVLIDISCNFAFSRTNCWGI